MVKMKPFVSTDLIAFADIEMLDCIFEPDEDFALESDKVKSVSPMLKSGDKSGALPFGHSTPLKSRYPTGIVSVDGPNVWMNRLCKSNRPSY